MNRLYPKWKQELLQGSVNTSLTGTVNALLIDTGAYTYSDVHQFLTDVPGGARVGAALTLSSKTFALGVFDAADLNFVAVTGPTVEAMILYISTGADATSRLVGFIDSAINLPFTPSGIDQPVLFDPQGLFGL